MSDGEHRGEERYGEMRNDHQTDDEGLRMRLLRKFVDKLLGRIVTWDPASSTQLTRSLYNKNLSEHWQEIWGVFEGIYIVGNERLESSSQFAETNRLKNQLDELRARNADLSANYETLRKQDRRNQSTILQLQYERETKNQTIRHQRERNRALIARHKQDLNQKVQENRKLHAIIVQGGQDSHPYDDQNFTAMFGELQVQIEHLVKTHFPASRGETGWKEYDTVRAQEDRDFFLQAHIATVIAQEFFSHDARLFDLDERTEEGQAAFEKKLQECNVPTPEIAKWRIQTMRVAGLMMTRENRYHRITKACQELSKDLSYVFEPVSRVGSSALYAPDALCRSAFNVALSIRTCRAEYMWHQRVPPALLQDKHYQRIENYNIGPQGPTGRPTKVLFGPVYKLVDDMPVLLRSGIVLCS